MNIIDFPKYIIFRFFKYLDIKSSLMFGATCKHLYNLCLIKQIKKPSDFENINSKIVKTLVYNAKLELNPTIEVEILIIPDKNVVFDRIINAQELHIFLSKANKTFIKYVLQFVKNFKKFICNFELDLSDYSMPDTLEHVEAENFNNYKDLKYVLCEYYYGEYTYINKLICNDRSYSDNSSGEELHFIYSKDFWYNNRFTVYGFKKIYFEGFKNLEGYDAIEISSDKDTEFYFNNCDKKFEESIKITY